MKFSEDSEHAIIVEVVNMMGMDRIWMRVVAESEEKVYGGGNQFSYFNLRGKDYPIWTREQGKI